MSSRRLSKVHMIGGLARISRYKRVDPARNLVAEPVKLPRCLIRFGPCFSKGKEKKVLLNQVANGGPCQCGALSQSLSYLDGTKA